MNHVAKLMMLLGFLLFFGPSSTSLAADNGDSPAGTDLSPQLKILDQWRGRWKVTATHHYPEPKTLTYDESYEWVGNGRFLRGETSLKADGGQGLSILWYDAVTKSYRVLLFNSKGEDANGDPRYGYAVELPPSQWDEKTQTMTSDSGLFSPVKYTGHTTFTNKDTMHSRGTLKDGIGRLVVDIETIGIRQK